MPFEPIPDTSITISGITDNGSIDIIPIGKIEASREGERTYKWTDDKGNTYQQSVILIAPCVVAHDETSQTLHVIPLEQAGWRTGMKVLDLIQSSDAT